MLAGIERDNSLAGLELAIPFKSVFESRELKAELEEAIQSGSSSTSLEIARHLALKQPISEYPYEAALTVAVSTGDDQSAEKFARFAIDRQPRSLVARLYLFDKSEEREDYNELILQYDRLMELRSLNEGLLSDALVGVFRQTGDWSVLFAYLEARPRHGGIIMDRLLRVADIPPELTPLLAQYPTKQPAFLTRLIADEGYTSAYIAWLSFVDMTYEQSVIELPFNGHFQNASAPPPFNWSIETKRAEIQPDGGLFVSFSGSGSPLYVRQVLSAPAGSYLLRTNAIGRMSEKGGELVWNIVCAESGRRLLNAVIRVREETSIDVSDAELSIPESGCDFQTMELRGRAGEFPITSTAEILSVALIQRSESDFQ